MPQGDKISQDITNIPDIIIKISIYWINWNTLFLQKYVHMSDPAIDEIFKISRDYCYTINSIRMRQHSEKQN